MKSKLPPYINHQRFSTNGPLTVEKMLEILKEFPPEMELYFNVEQEKGGVNWDTKNVSIMAEKWLCPGYPGCSHEQPEMDYELVIFVKYPTIDGLFKVDNFEK